MAVGLPGRRKHEAKGAPKTLMNMPKKDNKRKHKAQEAQES